MSIRLGLRSFLGIATLSTVGYAIASSMSVVACSDSAVDPGGTTTSDAPGQPPPKPNASATASADYHTYAVDSMFLGLSTRAGVTDNNAWKSFGYNIDKLTSTESSKDVCTGDGAARTDGDNGIDNAFGKKIAPSLTLAAPTFEASLNAAIKRGGFSIIFDIKGLSGDAKQSATGLGGAVFGGGYFGDGKTPKFDGTDNWPISKDSLKDGATLASGSTVVFSDAYVNAGTFVARAPLLDIAVQITGQVLTLKLRNAVVTFVVDGNNAANGTLAGVLNTQEFISELKTVGPYLSPMLCGPGAALLDSFASASDIMSDGTNAAGKSCDGISVGIGFTAKAIARPSTVDARVAPVTGDPCKDAGH